MAPPTPAVGQTVPAAGRHWALAPVAAAGAGAAALLLLHVVDPNEPGHYPVCPFLAVTGRPCPGCGSLRAIHALTKGDVLAALSLNALTVVMLPVTLLLWGRWADRRRRGVRALPIEPRWLQLIGAVAVVFWIVRNLPFGAVLAP